MSHQAQPDFALSFFSGLYFYNQTCCWEAAKTKLTPYYRLTCITEGRTSNLSLFYSHPYFVCTPCSLTTLSSQIPNLRYLLSYPRELFPNLYRLPLFAQPSPACHI